MKKLILILFGLLLTGCYTFVEYDALHSTKPGPWAYDFDHPGLEKHNGKVIAVYFDTNYEGTEKFYIKVYSKTKGDFLFLKKAIITGDRSYKKELSFDEEISVDENAYSYKSTLSGNKKTMLPIYKGSSKRFSLASYNLFSAAEFGNMEVKIVFTDTETLEEKSAVYPIKKKHYKYLAPPT